MQIRIDGVTRQIKRLRLRRGGSLVVIRRIRDSELRTVYLGSDPLSVTISPPFVSKTTSTGGASQTFSSSIAGGRGPYSYAWTITNDGTKNATLSGASNASCIVSASLTAGQDATGEIGLTVTDADGLTATAVSAYFTFSTID